LNCWSGFSDKLLLVSSSVEAVFKTFSIAEYYVSKNTSGIVTEIILNIKYVCRVGVAQSVECLTTDWMAGILSLEKAKDFSSSLCVQISSEAHPTSYPMVAGVKAWEGRDADLSLHLVLKSRMSRSYTSSPHWRMHGVYETALTFLIFRNYV
jgi:hypothetical protein